MKIFLLILVVHLVLGVDKNNFKKCDESSFCKRHRKIEPRDSPYVVKPETVSIGTSSVTLEIENTEKNIIFSAELNSLTDGRARLRIREKNPIRHRYEVQGALIGEPELERLVVDSKDGSSLAVVSDNRKVVVSYSPFRVDFMIDETAVVTLNAQGLLEFEHYREKRDADPPVEANKDDGFVEIDSNEDGQDSEGGNDVNSNEVEVEPKPSNDEDVIKGPDSPKLKLPNPDDVPPPPPEDDKMDTENDEDDEDDDDDHNDHGNQDDDSGMWEEYFKSHRDSKPYGPSAVSMDISFPGCEHVFGIPEHADSLALKVTKGSTDPYRLYNLDVFEYELNSPMALYGSIPYMVAHSAHHTVGVFWHNAAETWVDISSSTTGKSVLSRLIDYFKSEQDLPQTDTHWISESGIIDIFVMFGPGPLDVFRQYSKLTGTTPLPPLFALAYHQSRWNYNDQEDVEQVNKGFDDNNIPYDVLWLDIEHTDGKKYFTWDSVRFPDSKKMLNDLYGYGHRMVTIIDPHVKRESGYHIHEEAQSKGFYVKTKDNSDYEGHCWPGSSSWLDFVNPEVREWYATKYELEQYQGSTLSLFTWNDMNEPSVFDGPEITMHKDTRHFGDWEHRDIHNVYGMYQQQASSEGQVRRSGGKERPFVLSRAFFAGSQRYGAIWTGDNYAGWDHLAASMPMLMSIGLAGLPFIGADVGGFFRNPSEELLSRWYQAGAYQPFFRAHAHLDTRRREPWLFSKETLDSIRETIKARYALLPYWYTEFYKTSQTGAPVMRPLWVDFPDDPKTYNMEDEYLIGSDLLVKPVTSEGDTSISVYLPGKHGVWYDQDVFRQYDSPQGISMPVSNTKIPVFIRGGGIIPKKLRPRRSSTQMLNDPYTLYVALDKQGHASGLLYADDGHSFDYKNGQFLLRSFEFSNNALTSRSAHAEGVYQSKSYIERVIILGVKHSPTSVTIIEKGSSFFSGDSQRTLKFTYDTAVKSLVVKKPGANIGTDFTLQLS